MYSWCLRVNININLIRLKVCLGKKKTKKQKQKHKCVRFLRKKKKKKDSGLTPSFIAAILKYGFFFLYYFSLSLHNPTLFFLGLAVYYYANEIEGPSSWLGSNWHIVRTHPGLTQVLMDKPQWNGFLYLVFFSLLLLLLILNSLKEKENKKERKIILTLFHFYSCIIVWNLFFFVKWSSELGIRPKHVRCLHYGFVDQERSLNRSICQSED